MNDSSKIFDDLCEKLKPHVRSAMANIPTGKDEASAIDINTEALYNFLLDEAPEADPKERDDLKKELYEALGPSFRLDLSHYDEDWINLCTEILTSTWSETLHLISRGQSIVRLRDCLLPDKRVWDVNTDRFGIPQEQIENLLRDFAKAELEKGIELPWGGFVTKDANGPILICEPRG